MELRHLATFRVVATTASFTRAAEQLHYVQSSVTVHIQALEHELGVPLFDRLGRRIALTEAGRCLLPYAERLLTLADEARDAVVGTTEVTGTLTISAPESVCTYRLPALLHRYRQTYPGVHLVFRPLLVSALRQAVREGTVDAAFVLDEPVLSAQLSVASLMYEPVTVLATRTHPLASSSRVHPIDLNRESLLLTEEGCGYRTVFMHALAEAGVRPVAPIEFGSVEAIKQCVMAEMGVTVLPAMAVVAEMAAERMIALPWTGPELAVWTQLVWHREKWLSPALRAFITMACSYWGVTQETH